MGRRGIQRRSAQELNANCTGSAAVVASSSDTAESTNAKPHDDHGALKHRHIAVASFRCATATRAGT